MKNADNRTKSPVVYLITGFLTDTWLFPVGKIKAGKVIPKGPHQMLYSRKDVVQQVVLEYLKKHFGDKK